jgi:hypothetical protein
MKTFTEQVASLKATRETKALEQRAVAQKSVDEGRSMNSAEHEQFDTLDGEIKSLDGDIARLSLLAEQDRQTAKPVSDEVVQKSAGSLPVQVKNTEKLEPGLSFARMARVKAVAAQGFLGTSDERTVAKAIYPHDDRLIETIIKAAVPAASTTNLPWAGNMIIEGGGAFADFVEFLRPRSLVGRISDRLRRLPFDTPVLVQGTGGTAKWTREGAAKPLTQWTYTRTKLEPLKVAAIAAATKETLMRASAAADALLRDELARAVNAAIDTTFIDPAAAASAGVSPGSILNGVAALTLTPGGTTPQEEITCDVQQFFRAFVANNQSLEGAFWIMPEIIAVSLGLLLSPLGQPAFPGVGFAGGTFFGLPVFITNYAPTTSAGSVVALVKGDEIFLGDEGGIQVATSDQASLVMDDAPSMNSTTPTPATMVSMFQTNSVAFLVERFINWQRRRTQSVVWARVGWSTC